MTCRGVGGEGSVRHARRLAFRPAVSLSFMPLGYCPRCLCTSLFVCFPSVGRSFAHSVLAAACLLTAFPEPAFRDGVGFFIFVVFYLLLMPSRSFVLIRGLSATVGGS